MNTLTMKPQMQFIKFTLVGVSNSVVYLGVYFSFLLVSDAIFMRTRFPIEEDREEKTHDNRI